MKIIKKILPLTILFFVLHTSLKGQYIFTPSTAFVQKADTNSLTYDGITITNTGLDTVFLKWKLTYLDTVPGSYFDFCETGNCWLGIPDSGSVTPILPTQIGWLKMHFWAGAVPGISTAKIYVYDIKSPSAGDTLTYILDVSQGAGVTDIYAENDIKIFPNPSYGEFQLHLNGIMIHSVTCFDINGKKINIEKDNNGKIILCRSEQGIYFLKMETGQGTIVKKLIVGRQ